MPPRRSGNCVDSASSAIYKRLAETRVPPGESGWAESDLCDISHNGHWSSTKREKKTQKRPTSINDRAVF